MVARKANCSGHRGTKVKTNRNCVAYHPLRAMLRKGEDSASDGGASGGAEGTAVKRQPTRSRNEAFAIAWRTPIVTR